MARQRRLGRQAGIFLGRALAAANVKAIDLMRELREQFSKAGPAVVISGCVGPRGDGYIPDPVPGKDEAQAYHAAQIGIFAKTEADMVTAITMTNANEAVGVTRAAKAVDMPVAIAFTVETDGRLPTGQLLKEAIEEVDDETGRAPAYYMINCAHTTHFNGTLAGKAQWIDRIRGIRANASRRSHAELNEAPDLGAGDPAELGGQYADLRRRHAGINVLGGCCGTDHRHIQQIASACKA